MRITSMFAFGMSLALAPALMAAGTDGFEMSNLVLPLVLTVIGVFLLVMEATVIPGFGVAGVLGALVLAAGLFFGIRDLSTVALSLEEGGIAAICSGGIGSMLGVSAAVVGMVKVFPKLPGAKRLVHQAEQKTSKHDQEGHLRQFVGATGVARTDLRPAGKIRIGEEDFDVTTDEGWINAGDQISVSHFHEGHLVVKRVV